MAKTLKTILPAVLLLPVVLLGLAAASPHKEDAGVVFSHKLHFSDNGIECATCHDKVAESTSGRDDLMPVKDACLQCHDEDMLKEKVSRTDLPRMGRLVNDYNPKFNHAKHLEKKIDCERCHVGLAESDSSFSTHMPVMALCMSCHDGATAPRECITCHETPRGLIPDDHQSLDLWRKGHGDKARFDNGRSCTMCHERNDCQECHQGDNVLPRVHPIGFEFNHPLEVRSNRTDCSACHEDRAFCMECHTERQVYPRSHQRSGWANPATGGRHTAEARMNIEQCTACHEDDPGSQPVCTNCHGQ